MHPAMVDGVGIQPGVASGAPASLAGPGSAAPAPTAGLGSEVSAHLQPPGTAPLGASGLVTPGARMNPATDFGESPAAGTPSPDSAVSSLTKPPGNASITQLPKVEGVKSLHGEAQAGPARGEEGDSPKAEGPDHAEAPVVRTQTLEATRTGHEHSRQVERSLGPHRGEESALQRDKAEKSSENLKEISTPKGQFKNPAWRLMQDVLSNPVLMAAAAGIAGYAMRGGKGGLIGAGVGVGLSFAAAYGFKQMKK